MLVPRATSVCRLVCSRFGAVLLDSLSSAGETTLHVVQLLDISDGTVEPITGRSTLAVDIMSTEV